MYKQNNEHIVSTQETVINELQIDVISHRQRKKENVRDKKRSRLPLPVFDLLICLPHYQKIKFNAINKN